MALALASVLVAACGTEESGAPEESNGSAEQALCNNSGTTALQNPANLPPAPRGLDPDSVAMVDTQGHRDEQTRNAVPSMRTTPDGRIGLGVKALGDGNLGNTILKMFLLRPEVANNTNDAEGGMDPYDADINLRALDPNVVSFTSAPGVPVPTRNDAAIRALALCNSNVQVQNVGGKDRYNLTLIGFNGNTVGVPATTWWLDVTATVTSPRTPSATMSVVVNEVHRGPDVNVKILLEPMLNDDGKLLSGRIDSSPLQGYSGNYDIVYGYMNTGAADTFCDKAKFDAFFAAAANASPNQPFKPILYAANDPDLKNGGAPKYGFASRPWRDARNNLVGTGTSQYDTPDLSGSYPWMDRHGRNFFFYAIATTNAFGHTGGNPRFAYNCVDGTTGCFQTEAKGRTRGLSVVGSWTNGKIVLLDGKINNVDFGTGVPREKQENITLYSDGSNGVAVRFASGRDNGVTTLGNTTDNMTIVDSIENTHNAKASWVPETRRDVVWKVSRGHISDEVAFDDFVDPNVFLYAPMNGVVDPSTGRYFDGFDLVDPQCPSGQSGNFYGSSEVRVQNSATRPPQMGRIPVEGTVSGSPYIRIEPAALGGTHGRGLYLPPSSALSFTLDNPVNGCTNGTCTDAATSRAGSYYLGFFVDTKSGQGPFDVLNVAGKFKLTLSSGSVLITPANGAFSPMTVTTPAIFDKWTHIGLLFASGDKRIHVYVDGLEVGSTPANASLAAALAPDWNGSVLSLKSPATGTNGVWVDELKIVLNAEWTAANNLAKELPCNHAGGSIYSYDGSDHCEKPADSLPAGAVSKRATYLGMADSSGNPVIHASLPRPASFATNAFCKSCHVGTGTDMYRVVALGLSPDAIAAKTGSDGAAYAAAATDPRRQPMVPPRYWQGNMPAGTVDIISPAWPPGPGSYLCTGTSCNIDQVIFPP